MATRSRSIRSLHSHGSLFRALSANPTPSALFTRSFHSGPKPYPSISSLSSLSLHFLKPHRQLAPRTPRCPQMIFSAAAKSTPALSNQQTISRSASSAPIPGAAADPSPTPSIGSSIGSIRPMGFGPRSRMNDGGHGMVEGFDTLSDGMDAKLKRAATTFQVSDEILNDDYAFRPDVIFLRGTTYTTRDVDLMKPGIQKSSKRAEFETTTAEVLRKADLRNVRFLANFLTEAGIIVKRSQTKISAKAQRKVAREIKTARALGLMPFSTMGTKPFFYGKPMEDLEEDYEYDTYYGSDMTDAAMEPVEES